MGTEFPFTTAGKPKPSQAIDTAQSLHLGTSSGGSSDSSEKSIAPLLSRMSPHPHPLLLRHTSVRPLPGYTLHQRTTSPTSSNSLLRPARPTDPYPPRRSARRTRTRRSDSDSTARPASPTLSQCVILARSSNGRGASSTFRRRRAVFSPPPRGRTVSITG